MPSELKARLQADMKTAMKAREKKRLGTIRLALAALKQREVDDRIELDDTMVLAIIDKMVKQRRDSLAQFEAADREDLAAQERLEIDILMGYLPRQLSESEVETLVEAAVTKTGAASMKDMGALMGALRPQVQGRADMQMVSSKVKARLTA
jgi:uncharacterized protein YqeY